MLNDGEVGKANEESEQYDFDLFVIGAGSGGVRASRFSTQFGAKVINRIPNYILCNVFEYYLYNPYDCVCCEKNMWNWIDSMIKC